MATALESVDNLTVRSLTRGFNQAAVLVAEHAIKIDDAAALEIGTEVTYTDDDLGFVFRGRIVDRKELWQNAEGVQYSCADVFRTLSKTPATISSSSKIRIKPASTIHSAMSAILDELPAGLLPGGYDLTDLPDFTTKIEINKGGQSVGTWINEILKLTSDGVAWIEYVDVSGEQQPKLILASRATIGTLDLLKGNYGKIDPQSGALPLIESGNIGETLDRKYGGVRIEGCGAFERFDLKWIPASTPVQDTEFPNHYTFDFEVPEEWATGRYINADGNCKEDIWARLQIGQGDDALVVDAHNLQVNKDEDTGKFFFRVKIVLQGVFSTWPPPVPILQGWFTYTGYTGPLVADFPASDPRLSGEGYYIEQHPEFFSFSGSGISVGGLSVINAFADELFSRYCLSPDTTGSVVVHIKGLDPDVVLGAKITDPSELDGSFVQGISYEFVRRSMSLQCSEQPVRSEVFNAQRRTELASELGGNWYLAVTDAEPSCFCGGEVYTDEDGTASPGGGFPGTGGGGGDGETGPTWDCIQGTCVERDDDQGQYTTLADCERDCFVEGWDFVPCAGCLPSEQGGFAQYLTEVECTTDNPDPFDPIYNCGSGGSDPGVPSGPPDPADKVYECIGCSESSEGFFIGFIKRITINRGGHIISAECDTCDIPAVSGYTGDVSVVTDVVVTGCTVVGSSCSVGLSLGFKILTFSDGLLINVTVP